ncbi:hypothetical protein VR46_03980 [Streptomyces sp. NRRL S-444]|nr:hypothetical protein VR46_03980 [Streptomyces sp. NRRL S-444]
MARSSELRMPDFAIRARRASQRSGQFSSTSKWSGCRTPRAVRVCSQAGRGPLRSARSQEASYAASMMRSESLVDRAFASGESKGIFILKKTSWRPIAPRPTGRHRALERPACSVG